jgi:hypothetical protein
MDEGIQFDRAKFLNVIHYVVESCRPEELGRVKLHKILYYSDMLSYLAHGRPLTGEEYRKQKFGPSARHLQAGLAELQDLGRIKVVERSYYGYPKQDFIALIHAEPQSLSADEMALVDDVIDFVCVRTAKEISELSHDDAWRLAEMGERIPYFMAASFVPVEITDDDRAWARGEARKIAQSTA